MASAEAWTLTLIRRVVIVHWSVNRSDIDGAPDRYFSWLRDSKHTRNECLFLDVTGTRVYRLSTNNTEPKFVLFNANLRTRRDGAAIVTFGPICTCTD